MTAVIVLRLESAVSWPFALSSLACLRSINFTVENREAAITGFLIYNTLSVLSSILFFWDPVRKENFPKTQHIFILWNLFSSLGFAIYPFPSIRKKIVFHAQCLKVFLKWGQWQDFAGTMETLFSRSNSGTVMLQCKHWGSLHSLKGDAANDSPLHNRQPQWKVLFILF